MKGDTDVRYYGNNIKILGPNKFYLIWCFSKKCFVIFLFIPY